MNLESTFGSSPHSVEAMISGLSTSLLRGAKRDEFLAPKSVYGFSARRTRSKTVRHAYLTTKEIIEHLKHGYRLTPDNADSYLPLAQAHIQLGHWEETIEVCTTSVNLFSEASDPRRETKMALAYFFRGYAYGSLARKLEDEKQLRNLRLSENDYLDAIRLHKSFISAYCYLGVLLSEQGRWDEAEKAFKQAIKIKPDYAPSYSDLGTMYLASGRPRLSVKPLKKALELKPREPIALRNLAEAYWQLGRWRDAQVAYREAIGSTPKDETLHYKLGTAYAAQGELPKAANAFKAAIRLKKNYAGAYNNLGAIYFTLGRVHDAVEAFSKALEIEPDNEAANNSLNEIRYQMLEGVIRSQLKAPKHRSIIDFESLAEQLAETREHIFGEQSRDNPFEGYTPDEILSAFSMVGKRMTHASRLTLAAKFLEQGLLSSGKAAQLAGLDRLTFLKELRRIGVNAPGLQRKEASPVPINVEAAVSLLQSWNDGDPGEQRETWRYLKAALDKDRLSDRKLFR